MHTVAELTHMGRELSLTLLEKGFCIAEIKIIAMQMKDCGELMATAKTIENNMFKRGVM